MDTHTATTRVFVETPACIRCGLVSRIEVAYGEYIRWCEGALVQDVWPNMPKETRELLITGTHDACWQAMFGTIEEAA